MMKLLMTHTRGDNGAVVDSDRRLRFLREQDPVSREISDLLLFVSWFASQSKGKKWRLLL